MQNNVGEIAPTARLVGAFLLRDNPPPPPPTPPSPDNDKPECERMVIIQLIVFIVFYVSLILIIIIMYCKYRRECKEMEKNVGSEVNYRIIKRLMEQYDQHEGVTGERTTVSAGDSSRHT